MKKTIVLAAGCFWGTQAYFRRVKGVLSTRVGYAQGHLDNPTYKEVKAQISGHTEVCEVVYDNSIISYNEILEHYFRIIDPTSINKQGEDEGTSYRTGIYALDESDLSDAMVFIKNKASQYDKPIVVECEMLKIFYDAEEYHQDYLEKNPNGYCHIDLNLLK